MIGRVLVVAGSDSGGGAGIQADIKSIMACGAYAMTAITAVTVQNTLGVFGVHEVPPAVVADQMRVVLEDLGADVVKLGMLHRVEVIEAVADVLDGAGVPVVLDPVMVAKGGASLLDERAVGLLKQRLVAKAALVTPNMPEAEGLTGIKVVDAVSAEAAGQALLALGAKAVLVKGGHGEGDVVEDWLVRPDGVLVFQSPRIESRHTHGTGCTLASAIAAFLAQGVELGEAVRQARDYVWQAIAHAPGLGRGHGPLGHSLGHGVRTVS